MIKLPGGGHGTGFLVDLPNHGLAFLTAGHNFKSGTTLPDDLDISKFSLHFGNIEGDLSGTKARKTCTLQDLGPVKGSIGYRGKRIYFPGNFPGKALPHEDYCVLVFTAPDIKETLKTMGLAYLKCGVGGFLKHTPGGLVIIHGHPANKDIRREDGGKYPLRQSIGVEMANQGADSAVRLLYDNSTLPGNSGSPVIGRGNAADHQSYAVKGIHVSAELVAGSNSAQGLWNMDDWIPAYSTTVTLEKVGSKELRSLTSFDIQP